MELTLDHQHPVLLMNPIHDQNPPHFVLAHPSDGTHSHETNEGCIDLLYHSKPDFHSHHFVHSLLPISPVVAYIVHWHIPDSTHHSPITSSQAHHSSNHLLREHYSSSSSPQAYTVPESFVFYIDLEANTESPPQSDYCIVLTIPLHLLLHIHDIPTTTSHNPTDEYPDSVTPADCSLVPTHPSHPHFQFDNGSVLSPTHDDNLPHDKTNHKHEWLVWLIEAVLEYTTIHLQQ